MPNLDSFKPIPAPRLGGMVDYQQGPNGAQDSTKVVPGCAILAQEIRYEEDQPGTRFGTVTTMARQQPAGIATGIDCLQVLGSVNPGQIPVVFDDQGNLLEESPVGSGAMVPLTSPIPLPAGARMQTTQAENRLYMAFNDGVKGLIPPIVLDGPTGKINPVSQNPIGSLWTGGRYAQIGDLVRSSSNPSRWFRCTVAGLMGSVEPAWPPLDGYTRPGNFIPPGVPFFAASIKDPSGVDQWTEWTPGVASALPAPEAPTQVISVGAAHPGTIAAGLDIYICFAYFNSAGESAWTAPLIFQNTIANDNLAVAFQSINSNPGPTSAFSYLGPSISPPWAPNYGGPRMPQWLQSVLGLSDPEINWPSANCLRVYVAAVGHGNSAPLSYGLYQTTGINSPILISSVPALQATTPRTVSTALLTNQQFIGQGGSRNLVVLRKDLNDSLAPVSPDSSIPVAFAGNFNSTILSIARDGSGNVSAQVADISQFSVGQVAGASGIADGTFNGSVTITELIPDFNYPTGTVVWVSSTHVAANSSGGTLGIQSGSPPVIVLPPGGSDDSLDIAAFTVATASTAGPYFYISQSDPAIAPSANIISQDYANNIAIIAIDNPTGFAGGQTSVIVNAALAVLDGVANLASVVGNTLTFATTAGGSGATGAGGIITVQPNLPTAQPASQRNITSISRDALGNVLAHVSDIDQINPGHRLIVAGVTDPTFDDTVIVKTVNPDLLGFGGTIGWASSTLVATHSLGGNVSGAPGIICNFDDTFLSSSADLEVTNQLTSSGAPNASDVYWCPSLQMMVYVNGLDEKFYFSDQGDAANLSVGSGLGIVDRVNSLAIAIRELDSGEIIALKTNGGYAVNASDLAPAQWNSARRWEKHGPPCAAAVGVGTGFLCFPSAGEEGGAYLYQSGSGLEWISKEFSTTWKRVNWSAAKVMWTEVDEQAKEVHFGVPLDGATQVTHELVCTYFSGWDFPEVLNRMGKLITARSARKWSISPIASKTAKVVQRVLSSPVNSQGAAWPLTHFNRTNGIVTLTFANAAALPPVSPQDELVVTSKTDPSFNGTIPVTSINQAAFQIIYAQAGPNADHNAAAGDSASMLTQVPMVLPDARIFNRQFLRGINAQVPWKTFSITIIRRSNGVVTANVIGVPTYGAVGSPPNIIVAGASDESMNGAFGPYTIQNSGTQWTIQWNQSGPDSLAGGGTVSTTIGMLRVTMVQPDRYDDDGIGIDCQYEPAFANDGAGTSILRFGGFRGQVSGAGTVNITPVIDDDTEFPSYPLTLLPDVATHFERGLRLDNEYASLLYSNNKVPGAWFLLQQHTMYANPYQAGRRGNRVSTQANLGSFILQAPSGTFFALTVSDTGIQGVAASTGPISPAIILSDQTTGENYVLGINNVGQLTANLTTTIGIPFVILRSPNQTAFLLSMNNHFLNTNPV